MKSDVVRRCFEGFPRQMPDDHWGMDIDQPDWVMDAHNTKSGRVFMFGTGPSLAGQRELLKMMQDEDTWTVNRMALFNPPFTPTYHGVTEPGPIGGWGSNILQMYDFPTAENRIAINWWILDAPPWKWVAKAPGDVQVRWEGWFGLGNTLPPIPTAWASPVTFAQLACWFGYTEIYFLGMDLSDKGQAWDVEHGRTKNPRSFRSILECVDRGSAQMKKAGRIMMDCSPDGLMSKEGVLEFVPLEELVAVPAMA